MKSNGIESPNSERELAVQRERVQQLLVEGVKEYAILMLDPDGTIVSWNGGAERRGSVPRERRRCVARAQRA